MAGCSLDLMESTERDNFVMSFESRLSILLT